MKYKPVLLIVMADDFASYLLILRTLYPLAFKFSSDNSIIVQISSRDLHEISSLDKGHVM